MNERTDRMERKKKKKITSIHVQFNYMNITLMIMVWFRHAIYTHHKFKFSETFTVFWYMMALSDCMLFHFRNVSLNNIGCDHQILAIHTHAHKVERKSGREWNRFIKLDIFFTSSFTTISIDGCDVKIKWILSDITNLWYAEQFRQFTQCSITFLINDVIPAVLSQKQWQHDFLRRMRASRQLLRIIDSTREKYDFMKNIKKKK